LQSIKPLVVHDGGKGDINVEQLQMLMDRIGLTKEDLLAGTGSPPKAQCVDEW
jgi:antitoxin component HigA of HigAB toxin-antitoxin module